MPCRNQATGWGDLKGMVEFCRERKVSHGYVVTKEPEDFGMMERELEPSLQLQLVKIPAPLACYWLGKTEITAQPYRNGVLGRVSGRVDE